MPPPTLYSARPRFTVDGTDRPTLASDLLSLSVVSSASGISSCDAVFGNWAAAPGYRYFDRDVVEFGHEFEVNLGNPPARVFSGRIMTIEGGFPEGTAPTIRIAAEDRLADLRMTRRTRTYTDSSDGDLTQQIASRHGLQSAVDIGGPVHTQLAQVNQSDLAFLLERARAIDAEVWIEGHTLHAVTRSRRIGTAVRLGYSQELLEFSVAADLSHQRTRVRVGGWDTANKYALSAEAGDSALSAELAGTISGASILQQAIGDRTEAVVHESVSTSQDAEALAATAFRALARRFVVGRGIAEGNPDIRAGGYVNLAGLGPLFSGEYYVTECRHLFDLTTGFRTAFTAERPGIGPV